jgi:hypothetical protein
MLGVASVLSLAMPALAQKLLVLFLPVLAGVGCYRALRTIPVGRTAAVLGAACYALCPIVLWAVSEGRLPELVFLAGLPWLTGRLIGFFGSRPSPRRVRWIVGAAVGLAVIGSFFPGAALAAAVVVAVAVALPGGGGRMAGLARAAAATLAAAALAWPVVSGMLGAGGRNLADATGPRSFAQALRLSVGHAPGDWALAFFLPVAAALGLGFAAGRLRRPAARSLLLALAGVYLLWAAAAGWLPTWLSNPVAFGSVAAFGMASLAAMGLESVLEGLQRRSFGIAQIGSAALAGIVAIGLMGQAFQALRGSWDIGPGDRVSPAYAMVQPPTASSYRILWIGARLGGSFPAPGGAPMGRAPAGAASVRFSVTAPAGASAFDFGRPLDDPGYGKLADALSAVLSGPTRHGGALLAPFGIRYVVAGTSDLPEAVARRLGVQLDLVGTTVAGLTVYRDEVTVPRASVIPDPRWRVAAASGDATAVAALQDPDAAPLRGSDGAYRAGPYANGRTFPPGSSVLLAQQFDRHWQLIPFGQRAAPVRPHAAFGWAVGFPSTPTPHGFTVRFTGQGLRNAEVALLSIMWIAALWITRRPSRAD